MRRLGCYPQRAVNLRHAAVLVLTSWYLLAPPLTSSDKELERIAISAPLSYWVPYKEFDSMTACHTMELHFKMLAAQHLAKNDSEEARASAFRARNVRCVASDDPRLKEK